ncbi:sigma-70 family RNA polymerase sigma factor [Amycolatopsis sp. OK19-0408]|uniref:Sigma-70 family RNA polymerase sigma factor n=1 Tax=Amycolatopsis iheyensis TaxID=2945988 RepID=A0A9X2SR72_9PSEU|nr:sigma-70 family RNA polymerase sigma factor [Amycolatopsis iheyensis]MCR6490763.1 sigma-70 family RNA polymerase sigma factor [Amycolatopsis iheyensis]
MTTSPREHDASTARPSETSRRSAEELLGLVGRGDQAAFAELYDQLCAPMFGMVARMLDTSAQAEDVAHEAWLQIWQQAPRYAARHGSALTWMVSLTHRYAVDRVRADQPTAAAGRSPQTSEAVLDPIGGGSTATDQDTAVRHGLARLTGVQRQAILLAYYGGHTHREIAEVLPAPAGTVTTGLRDGLIHLREALVTTT